MKFFLHLLKIYEVKKTMISILLPLLVTINLFLLSKTNIELSWLFFSQLFSLLGTVLLSISFVLGSRSRFLEKIFGGLDKVIKLHHIIGGVSFVLLLNHPIFLALSVLPNFNLASRYIFFSADQIYNFGVMALATMTLLLIFTLIIKLPYDIWLKTHDFFGLVLLFASLHIFLITSDVSRYLPLRIWMMLVLAVGIYFYIFKVFLYKKFGPKYSYIVEKINEVGDVLEIYLKPENESIKYYPGQFAFINFDMNGLNETHPFSFSSSPDDFMIRFTIKIMGDYTLKLRQLSPGTKCLIWGSYGKLYYGFDGNKDVVCVAGGIGITPFVSLIRYEIKHIKPRKIYLFYSAKTEKSAIYHSDFIELESNLINFNYYPNFTCDKPQLSCQKLVENIGNLNNKLFYLCGPTKMMDNLSYQLQENGVKTKDIIFEDFSFKS